MENNAQPQNTSYPPYQALSPISDANDQQYLTAIKWALENRKEKDIKNIALTGPYGSGKSSILKTFVKQNTNPDLEFLNISLATFKEDIKAKEKDEKLLQLIELSILQQIFYHEEDKNIPNSRFKKIKTVDEKLNKNITVFLFVFIICALGLIYPLIWEDIVGFKFYDTTTLIIRYLSAIVVLVSSFMILRQITNTLASITVNKLKFQNAEIEIGKDITKSVLNHHLDEILYFFEVTKYTVVIIEDLDRFKNTEIFTKLRELNLLINNSKKIKRDIAFIYAVRDDMFKDKSRTKFFDFIIPIIPIITSSNSSEQFSIILKKLNYKIQTNLIEDISLFINDMRLLYNIVNEYLTYHHSLDKALDQNKILALIVYKNLYPDDFVQLGNEKGDLHKILKQKSQYLSTVLEQLNTKQSKITQEIADLQNLSINNENDLKTLYLQKCISKLYNYQSFQINGIERSFEEMLKDENFQYLLDDKVQYNQFSLLRASTYQIVVAEIPFPFSEVENEIHEDSFEDRKEFINRHNNNGIADLQNQVRKIDEEKTNSRKLKLSEVITKGDIKIELKNDEQNLLVNILLRNGYIDEDYQEFISIFYASSIEPSDRTFLLNIKSQIAMPIDFQLQKIDKLISKIHETDFEKPYILNINLLDHILGNKGYEVQQKAIIKLLSDGSDLSKTFMYAFIQKGINIKKFFSEIGFWYNHFYEFLSTDPLFTAEERERYFYVLLESAKPYSFGYFDKYGNISEKLEALPNILEVLPDSDRSREIIKKLDLKFKHLIHNGTESNLEDFIYENNHYELNLYMVEYMMKQYGNFSRQEFDTQNYSAIVHSECDHLLDYIYENPDEYAENIYLKLEANNQDREPELSSLLNLQMSIEIKQKVIEKVNHKIRTLKNIRDDRTIKLLVDMSMIEANWENVIALFENEEKTFSESLLKFLNDKDNYRTLSEKTMEDDKPDESDTDYEDFFLALPLIDDVSTIGFEYLITLYNERFELEGLKDVRRNKLEIMVKKDKLEVNNEIFALLKNNYPGLEIIYLERNLHYFLENNYDFEDSEIFALLQSRTLKDEEKTSFINNLVEYKILDNPDALRIIGKLLVTRNGYELTEKILVQSMLAINDTDARIVALTKCINHLSKASITEIIQSLPEPYSDIAVNGKRPLIPRNDSNDLLAMKLEDIGYISKSDFEKKGIRISTFRNI